MAKDFERYLRKEKDICVRIKEIINYKEGMVFISSLFLFIKNYTEI